MNLQVFPNWCKKLGISLCVLSFLGGFDSFLIGYYSAGDKITFTDYTTAIEYYRDQTLFKGYFNETMIALFNILILIGMLIYMLSKESVEDDFINKLRLESYQLAFFIITSITLILNIFGVSLDISVDTVIFLLLSSYLIIFAIKKRTV